MTAADGGATFPGPGHHPSPWPAEDGGPTRRQLVAALPAARPTATHRPLFGACMVVLRDPGEVFVQGAVPGPDSTAFVERVDPVTLATVVRSPDLPGGPWWPGGVVAHADGGLYVTHGRHVHRLDAATLEPTAQVRLPREHPYNSSLVLADGCLVTKDFLGTSGVSTPATGEVGSELVVLAPGTLEVLARHELPEPSIARISATPDGTVVVVGDSAVHRIAWDGTALTPAGPPLTYRHAEGQGHGWDAVLLDGAAWFLDDGTGSEDFGPSFRGRGVCTAPLRLHRVPLDGRPATSAEVCGEPGGLIANPPVIDPVRRIAIGYDSGNGVLTAFDVHDDGSLVRRWAAGADHAGHLLLDPTAGTVLTGDFDHERGTDDAVLRAVADGSELWRVDTHSPVQSVLFPAPGWDGDCYVTTFAGVTRLA